MDLKKRIQSDVACDSTIRTKFEDRDVMDNRGGNILKMKEYAKTMSRHQRGFTFGKDGIEGKISSCLHSKALFLEKDACHVANRNKN
jgi:hypothetical protein